MFGKASLAVLAKCPPSRRHRSRAGIHPREDRNGGVAWQKRRQASGQDQGAGKASIGFTLGSEAASFEIRSNISQIGFLLDRVAEADGRIAALLESPSL